MVILPTFFFPAITVPLQVFTSSLVIPGIMTSFRILPFLVRFCTSLDEQLLFPHLLAVLINKNSEGNVQRQDFIQKSLGLMLFPPSNKGVIYHCLAHILVQEHEEVLSIITCEVTCALRVVV